MKKFNEFYLQRLFESVLEVDPNFFDTLNRMPSDPISNKIFHWVENEKDVVTKYNFLSEDPKNPDKILFIPDSQYQRMKSQGQDPKTKTKSDSAIGRFARALMKDNNINVSDPEIETFVTNYKKLWTEKNSPPQFKIVKGDDILYWYNQNNYYDGGRSTLGNSCMRYDEKNYFMNLYAKNPEKISLAIITKIDSDGDEKLIARSLIWNLGENKFYCDRIYYNDEPLLGIMRTFVSQNISGEVIFHDKNDVPALKVDLNKVKFDKYPYADSIVYVCFKIVSGQLSESGFVMSNRYYTQNQEELEKNYAIGVMQRTSGDPEYINFVYLSRYRKYYFKSETISWDGELYPKEECKFSNYIGGHYVPKYLVVYSKYLKDWIMKDSAINHPKFGIVPDDYFTEAILSYNGNSVYPWDILDDVERRGIEAFETTQIPRKEPIDSDLYFKSPYHSKVNNVEVVWSNDFKENDVLTGGRFIPSIFSVDIVELSDTNNVPSNYIIGSNLMIATDFKLLGLNKRLINRSGKTSFYYGIKNDLNKINYIDTIDRIKRSRRLTLEEKKWRKSLLDWCDSYYTKRNDFTYKIENGSFDFESTVNQIFDIHKRWYKRRFWNDYGNYESYVDYTMDRGSLFTRRNWNEITDDEMKQYVYEYLPKIQFIWLFIRNSGPSRDYLKGILSKNATDEYRKLSELVVPDYTSFFGLIRDFLYTYEDNGASGFEDLIYSELNMMRSEFEGLCDYITELIKSGDFKQIINY